MKISRLWKKAKHQTEPLDEIPSWFQFYDPSARHSLDHKYFIYQSWIPEHTGKIISLLRCEELPMIDIEMFANAGNKTVRKEILRYAEQQPETYRKMCLNALARFKDSAAGLIVTLDWIPAMRHLVECAQQLHIPTILVPHESVFAARDMYYTHPRLGINTPQVDIICAWGALQEAIFIERGCDPNKIIKTGTPKLDYVVNMGGAGDRRSVELLGLDVRKKTITGIVQPLDSQFDQKAARLAQETAFTLMLDWASDRNDVQVIIRMPPSRDLLFSKSFYSQIAKLPNAAIDDSRLYLLTPEETIMASDAVVSINSTMLLEAALSGKPSISSKFIEFDQIWDQVKICVAKTADELIYALDTAIRFPEKIVSNYDLTWAEKALSVGTFDGGSAARVRVVLQELKARKNLCPEGADINQFYRPPHGVQV